VFGKIGYDRYSGLMHLRLNKEIIKDDIKTGSNGVCKLISNNLSTIYKNNKVVKELKCLHIIF
jgi:hypothetical protein